MKNIVNNYQISKTLRFGLTQKTKIQKEGYNGEIYVSHRELADLVKISEERIKKSVSSSDKSNLELSLDKIDICLKQVGAFLSDWQQVYYRKDQVALDKDYYKILCKKIEFDGFWKDVKGQRMPNSRIINISELDTKDSLGVERLQYVLNYWKDNLVSASQKYSVVEEKIKRFKLAIKINRTDNKPDEVELRKMFLSLANIVCDTLQPLCYGQISFPKINKLDDSRADNKKLIKFATDYKSKNDLLTSIAEQKKYFEENGGNVPFCRATLNPKTALKDPNSTDNSIKGEITQLGLDSILKSFKSYLFFENSLEHMSAKEKIDLMKSSGANVVKKGLMFKYKPIPVIVHREVAHELSKDLNKTEESLSDFLRGIGQAKSPAKDYEELTDKNKFNIEAYPIKVAFDFAWESLAKAKYHSEIDLPVAACEKFLNTFFDVKPNNDKFLLYAKLQELNALISTLEYGNPSDEQSIVEKIKALSNEIKWGDFGGSGQGYKKSISDWADSKKDSDGFKIAKQKIGLFRGGLRNEIAEYYNLTQIYKKTVMQEGKLFATMRDKITGAAEQNKVTHYAAIIEDKTGDKYVLLQEVPLNKQDRIYDKMDRNGDGYVSYFVNSITSRTIAKQLRKKRMAELMKNNARGIYNNVSNIQQPALSDKEKEERNIKEWISFISEKRWDYEFNLNFKGKNFEEIKKEVDANGYELENRILSRDALEELVKNKKCLLLPIVNQDIIKESKTESNQFTKDWNSIFDGNSPWRLTPEFRVSYRKPTPDYPMSDKGDKRYSRFQMIAHFLCDYIPQGGSYVSVREQIDNYKDDKKQEIAVKDFHDRLLGKTDEQKFIEGLGGLSSLGNVTIKTKLKKQDISKEKFYVFGIDRGQNELATLCVIDQDKKIQGGFRIYTRLFNNEKKQWEHKFLEERNILDLSNLRVETTIVIDGQEKREKVLVDLSEVKVKDNSGNYVKPNKTQIKLQQLAYIRKLQFQMQTNPGRVLEWYSHNQTSDLIIDNFVDKQNGEEGLVPFFGAAVAELKDTLPIDRISDMLKQFVELKNLEKQGEDVKSKIDQLIELEPADNLKSGVVANMVGVIAFLLKKYSYKVYISLEDLSKPFKDQIVLGISGVPIGIKKGMAGRSINVEQYAGLGLYNFFEMQLLKKLFRIQQDSSHILHLVPAFRAMKNYDNVAVGKGKIKNQFGIVFFVDAAATSKTCPCCGAINDRQFAPDLRKFPNAKKIETPDGKSVWLERDKTDGKDIIRCHVCGFDTSKEYDDNPRKYIKSGDDNAAYLISAECIKAYELATILVDNK